MAGPPARSSASKLIAVLKRSMASPTMLTSLLVAAALLAHRLAGLVPCASLGGDGVFPALAPLVAVGIAGAAFAWLIMRALNQILARDSVMSLAALICLALVGLFLVQEGSETLLRTGGLAGFETLALQLGVLVGLAAGLGVLIATGIVLVCTAVRAMTGAWPPAVNPHRETDPPMPVLAATPSRLELLLLAFGLARRGPPTASPISTS